MNVVSIQSEPVVLRGDSACWRNVHSLSDDDLFAEYHMIREEIRRRESYDRATSVH